MNDEFIRKLIHLRQLRKWTQVDIAQGIGISQSTYAGYERQTSFFTAEIFARILSLYAVEANYFFGYTDKNIERMVEMSLTITDNDLRVEYWQHAVGQCSAFIKAHNI